MQNLTSHQKDARAKNSVARLSIFCAAFLILLKAGAGWMTGSVSVLASLLDSAMDIFASILNFIAVRASSRPADEDHSYGHGKAESLAGLFQSIVIGFSGLFLIWEAIHRLIIPHGISSEWIGAATMVVSVVVSAALVLRLKRVARQTDSPAITSDAAHYVTDIYINLGVLVALLISGTTGWLRADPVISMFIAIYILWSAYKVARESVDALMDRKLPDNVDEMVAKVVGRYKEEGVLGFHALRTRSSGSQKFIDLHLEVEKNKRFDEAHDLTVKVLRDIEVELPRARVHIHTDPA